ncbi:MAG TPA: PfkB family carbohydrate kinase [Terracidiphilus sp.]
MNPPCVLFVGRSTLDVLYRLPRLPDENTKDYAEHFQAAPGGPALNAALTHALLGGKSMLVSAVGRGPWAAEVRAELDRRQIALLDLAAGTAYETPLTTVLIADDHSSRTIINPPLSTVQLPRWTGSWEQRVPADCGSVPPIVLTDGFHLAETLPLLASCKSSGAALCLDGGSWKPGTAILAPLLSIAICSEGFEVPGLDRAPESLFAWFASQGVPCIAITRGSKSILGWERGRRFEIEIASIDAIDTLGAGDVLHGAFCHFFALKPDFETALRSASEIATLSCRNFGIQATVGNGLKLD